MPLPNTSKFPYVDTLIAESKIAPQILIYSGDLSPGQEQLFEDLHKRAEDAGGAVFPINYKEIKDKLSYGNLRDFDRFLKLDNSKKDSPYNPGVSKADFIDLQRLVILYDMNSVFNLLEKKYPIKFNSREMLYADFDRQIQPIMNLLVKEKPGKELLVPASYIPIPYFANENGIRENAISTITNERYFQITFENNLIYCGKNNSSIIKEVIEKAINKEGVYESMCAVLSEPMIKILKLKGINNRFATSGVHISTGKLTKTEIGDIFDVIMSEVNKIGLLGIELEAAKDSSWRKDIPTLILGKYKQSKVPTVVTDVVKPKALKVNKSWQSR